MKEELKAAYTKQATQPQRDDTYLPSPRFVVRATFISLRQASEGARPSGSPLDRVALSSWSGQASRRKAVASCLPQELGWFHHAFTKVYGCRVGVGSTNQRNLGSWL